MSDYSIGVDLGGTNLRATTMDRDGELSDIISAPTQVEAGREAVIGAIVESVEGLRKKQGAEGLAGVGIGVPGFILLKEGQIVGSHNLPFFNDYPLRDEIQRRLGRPVILENDANAAALGEKWFGAGRDVDDLVLLTLGTGIGGGIVFGGKVLHGHVGMAGELGHITVSPNGNPCGCGNVGCLEKHASATAVETMAKLVSLGDDLTAKDVFDLATKGNELALRCFECMGRALGIGLANLINIFNFPLYLLSGGPLPAWEFFAPAMLDEIGKRSFTYRKTKTRVEKATLGNLAGLYGAAHLPFHN
ncbi:MAG: ROK family protein [Bryobacteraceae bacterium]